MTKGVDRKWGRDDSRCYFADFFKIQSPSDGESCSKENRIRVWPGTISSFLRRRMARSILAASNFGQIPFSLTPAPG